MCKHILNAQCCRKWYDCPSCHEENEDHELKKTIDMTFVCKKCKKAFRKDLTDFDEADSFCPHCDNEFMIPAQTPETEAEEQLEEPAQKTLDKLREMDARMIRDGEIKDEEMGFEPNWGTRLG